jgi:hypothetical protein
MTIVVRECVRVFEIEREMGECVKVRDRLCVYLCVGERVCK